MVTVLGDDLGATALAAHAGVSARHLARLSSASSDRHLPSS
ncbi:hypothetical protein AB4039_24385 [Streptomyces sp. M-16]